MIIGPLLLLPVPGVNDSLRAHDMSKSTGSTKTSHKQGIPWAQACNPRPVAGCRLVGELGGAPVGQLQGYRCTQKEKEEEPEAS